MTDADNRRLERLEEALAHLQLQLSDLDVVLRETTEQGLDASARLERVERAVRQLRGAEPDPKEVPAWARPSTGTEPGS